MENKTRNFLLDLFFPKFCFGCQKEGSYLCQDCEGIVEISGFHQKFKTEKINDLYFAIDYQKPLIKSLIQKFKYNPFVKEISKPLSSLIKNHFQMLELSPFFGNSKKDFVLIPMPLSKKRLKWRGFNQAEEIAKELSIFFNMPLLNSVLTKTKETMPQTELSEMERRENVFDIFCCQNQEKIQGKKILLVDDVYTTGSTMEEAARVLKRSGVKKVIGITVARASPGKDR
jgi:ComF family protein